jgi:hypothetical protein
MCVDKGGEIIHKGQRVWDGKWNNREQGDCTKIMPFYEGSRNVAGEDISSDIFFCQLIPVPEAINRGFYGEFDMTVYEKQLTAVFPHGVCDYSQADRARPLDL